MGLDVGIINHWLCCRFYLLCSFSSNSVFYGLVFCLYPNFPGIDLPLVLELLTISLLRVDSFSFIALLVATTSLAMLSALISSISISEMSGI